MKYMHFNTAFQVTKNIPGTLFTTCRVKEILCMEKKKICVVCGIILDDEAALKGFNQFLLINGDIETDADGNECYIWSRRRNGSCESEDAITMVKEMPEICQRYIARYKQYVISRNDVQRLNIHSDVLFSEIKEGFSHGDNSNGISLSQRDKDNSK